MKINAFEEMSVVEMQKIDGGINALDYFVMTSGGPFRKPVLVYCMY